MVTEHWAGSWSLPSSSSPALVSLSPSLSTNCSSIPYKRQGTSCRRARISLHGCRSCTGCSGCPRREWRPRLLLAARRPPRTNRSLPGDRGRFMKWGRWEGAEERQVERIGVSMPGREGATTSLSLLHSSPSSSSCGGWLVVAASAAELFIWRGARGLGSPLHITRSHLSQVSRVSQSGRYQQWSCGRGCKNYTAKDSMLPHREGSCLCQFWEFQKFWQNWHLLELKLKLLALKRISNLVLCKLLFPHRYIQHSQIHITIFSNIC